MRSGETVPLATAPARDRRNDSRGGRGGMSGPVEPRRGSRHLELSQNLLCFPNESAYSFFSGLSPGG